LSPRLALLLVSFELSLVASLSIMLTRCCRPGGAIL
jgi:hypothetical protein